ncbi:hypothetical protein [Streptacidiphilus fuscans]|uniref:Lipoprotein n=1 Tax=Streptacidiphilus fuscans TaxID=2789292 RepID=A0A931FE09_9ACTN|nr:hypothetical protein [Streptacidiphilus fuscans]MBF9070143.1 hypothetical protein [Streptacidiphilus fuscans]
MTARHLLPLLVVALLAASGCSATGSGKAPTTTVPGPTAPTAAAAAQPGGGRSVEPFDGLVEQSAAQQTLLQLAQSTLTAQCMRGRGFSYQIPRPPAPVDDAANSSYGLLTASTAAAQGYGITDNAFIRRADNATGTSAQPEGNRPGFMSALVGTTAHRSVITLPDGSDISYNADGCVTTAIVQLYGDAWNPAYYTLAVATEQIQNQVLQSPLWTSAVSAWSRCMNSTYHEDLASPQAARAQVAATVADAVAKAPGDAGPAYLSAQRGKEIALASQDAVCQARVGLASAAARAQLAPEQTAQTSYRADVATFATDLRTAVARAQQLVGQLVGRPTS